MESLEWNPYEGGDEYRVPMNTEKPGSAVDPVDDQNSEPALAGE
jgi:hypothetical protein